MPSPPKSALRLLAVLRRHPIVTASIFACLVLRVVLPEVVRWQVESRVSDLLAARVDVGDVDLWLLRGAVALQDVEVSGDAAAATPLIAWDELYVNIGWLALLRRTVRFDEVRLVRPRIDIERLGDGSFNLVRLLPPATPAAAESSVEGDAGAGWGVTLDELVIENGNVAFRDLVVAAPRPLHVEVRRLEVRDAALVPGVDERAAQVELDARVEAAPLRVTAAVEVDPELRIDASVDLRGLPMDSLLHYVPDSGWSAIRGRLDVVASLLVQGDEHKEVSGRVGIRDLAVEVPDLSEPALAWKSLSVEVGNLNMVAQHASVSAIDLDGASVVITPDGATPLALLPPPPSSAASSPPAPSDTGDSAGDSEADVKAWTWSLDRIAVGASSFSVLRAGDATRFGVRLSARDVRPGDSFWPLNIELHPEEGSLGIDGRARIEPAGFAGTVKWDALSLPGLSTAAGPAVARLVDGGTTSGLLEVAARSDDDGDGSDGRGIRVSGQLEVRGLDIGTSAAEGFGLGWDQLAVKLAALTLAGGSAGASAPGSPVTVRVEAIDLEAPRLLLTRRADGLALPGESRVRRGPPAQPTPLTEEAQKDGEAATPVAPAVQVRVGSVAIGDGQITFVDETFDPAVRQHVSVVNLKVRDVVWPEVSAADLSLESHGPGEARLRVEGGGNAAKAAVSVRLDALPLRPFHAYAGRYTGYGITGGVASLKTTLRLEDARYETDNRLVLHDLRVSTRSGTHLFRDHLGVPISLALSLLRDVNGDIILDVPFAGDRTGTRLGLAQAAAGTLRRVVLNAVMSPLKLVGMVALRHGRIKGVGIDEASFTPGTARPTIEGEKQIAAVAGLLASRPGIAVEIVAVLGKADLSVLRERALLADLSAASAPDAKADGETPSAMIRKVLEERAAGRDTAPDPAIAPVLEDLLSRQPVGAEELRNLAVQRAARARKGILSAGIDAGRVKVRMPTGRVGSANPAVRFEIGPPA